MSEPKPLLSLCIPTYNRAALLAEAMTSALSQLDAAHLPLVEIVVSDNASPDCTENAVGGVQSAYPGARIHYFRQPENRGFDANIDAVLRQGVGEFLLPLSDDDVFQEGALPRLLDALQQSPPVDVLGLNSGSFVTDSQTLRVLAQPVREDQVFADAGECLQVTGSGITFLSAFAVRRSLLAGRDYAPRIGSHILHSYVFLDALAAARRIVFLSQPLLGVRENNSGGYSYFEVFVTNFLEALAYAEASGYTHAAVEATRQTHLRRGLFPFVRAARLRGVTNPPNFWDGARRMLKAYGLNPFLLGRILPLLLLPMGLLRVVRALYLRRRPA